MPIYTKTGDKGKTALFGGNRVEKYDIQVESYGAVDEATSFIGFAIESLKETRDKALLTDIQMDLYSIMAFLSSGPFEKEKVSANIQLLESGIDKLEATLPKLTRFVLPQGSEAAARLHLARVVVRRAERRVSEYLYSQSQSHDSEITLKYINRLSDFLFMLARKYTTREEKT